jgi:hypothetical protein
LTVLYLAPRSGFSSSLSYWYSAPNVTQG